MRRTDRRNTLGMVAALALLGAPQWAPAHHSFAMFDQSRSIAVNGVVKEFRWTNPHVFIQVLAKGADGSDEEWSIEMTSPEHLARAGWRPGTLKAGDAVSLMIHPMRDATKGGQYLSGTGPRGPLIGGTPAPAQEGAAK